MQIRIPFFEKVTQRGPLTHDLCALEHLPQPEGDIETLGDKGKHITKGHTIHFDFF